MYHVAYEDVPTDEAIDLVLTLPRGSLWRSSQLEHGEWDDTHELAAEVVDAITRLTWMLSSAGTTEGAPRVTRPEDLRSRDEARRRAEDVRERIASTRWEEA